MITRLNPRLPKHVLYSELALIGEDTSNNAYPPFSDYAVGSAAMTWDGRVYAGTNTEDSSIGLTVHGEQAGIVAAIADGALKDALRAGLDQYSFLKAVSILPKRMFNGWPCGHCADFMSSFGQKLDIVVRKPDGGVDWKPLGRVVPYLPDARRALELTKSGEALKLLKPASSESVLRSFIPLHGVGWKEAYEHLLKMAEEAAHRSYAPYTKRPAGAAVWLWDGSVYAGARVENVGYTRSNHAEQAAAEAAITDGALARAIAQGLGPQQFVRTWAYVPLGQPDTWPTGSSRQCMCDFGLDAEVVIRRASGKPAMRLLRQLFPQAFAADVLSYWTSK
jgi:cytidine deaminase